MHEAKLAKMEAEMKMVFQQKVQEKEAKLKQSEEELYARHREMTWNDRPLMRLLCMSRLFHVQRQRS